MVRKLALCLLIGFCFSLAGVHAQEEATGQLRLVQIFYTSADISVDGEVVLPNFQYSFTSDYLPLPAGTHEISVAPAGAEGGSTLSVEVAADHLYTIVTMGEFEVGNPTLMLIDETSDFMNLERTGNDAIIIQNVPGAPPVDVYFLDELVIENLAFGGYGTAAAPLGAFKARATGVGQPDNVYFESDYFAVPGTLSLAYLAGTFPDEISRYFFTTTSDNMLAYLEAHTGLEGSRLTMLFEAIKAAGMADELASGEFTLFAPTNAAFEALPPEMHAAAMADPALLAEIVGYHLIPEYLPPYQLAGENSLTTVQGATLTTVLEPGKSFTVNGQPVGLQHRVANGAIYLIDTVLLPPQE